MTRQADNGLIFEGDVKMRNRKIPESGFVDVGNTTSLTTAAATDTQDRVSKRKGSYGQALDSLKTTKPTEIGLKMDTFDKTNLAMALMGEAAIIAAGAQTVTDEEVVIGKRGQLYKLKHGNIDPASIKVKDGSDQAIDADKVIYNDNAGLIGVAWTLASFLVVPVLVSRDIGPLDAVKESALLLKKTWGENLIGQGGVGLVFGLVFFALIIVGGAGIIGAATTGNGVLIGLMVALLIVALLVAALVQAALSGIYSAALYRYAVGAGDSEGFNAQLLGQAFRTK